MENYYLTLHTRQYKDALASIANNKSVHSYIISGQKGAGKLTFAKAFSAALLCENQGCFSCSDCKRVLSLQHPDVHLVESDKKTISVDLIRELLEEVPISPYEGKKKIYIIRNFGTATPQAQNALLKTLEEPPENVIFLLLCSQAEQLLITIRSRCREIKLGNANADIILKQLEILFPDNPNNLKSAKECDGNIGQAIELVSSEEYWELYNYVKQILDAKSMAKCASMLEDKKEEIDTILKILENIITQRMINDKQQRVLCLRRLAAVSKAVEQMKYNVNSSLIIDLLAYSLKEGEI